MDLHTCKLDAHNKDSYLQFIQNRKITGYIWRLWYLSFGCTWMYYGAVLGLLGSDFDANSLEISIAIISIRKISNFCRCMIDETVIYQRKPWKIDAATQWCWGEGSFAQPQPWLPSPQASCILTLDSSWGSSISLDHTTNNHMSTIGLVTSILILKIGEHKIDEFKPKSPENLRNTQNKNSKSKQ